MPRKICFPIDGSESSKNSMIWAINTFLREDDHIFIINVRPVLFSHFDIEMDTPYSISPEEMLEQEELTKKSSEVILEEMSGVAKAQHLKTESLLGEPRKTIEDWVNENRIDIVIIGKRGIGSLQSLIMGSTSDYLVHHLKIPCLIIPFQ